MLRMLDADELPAFRVELAEKQAATAGLIRTMTRLREIRRTVEIARHNMRDEALPDDIAFTGWFVVRLDDDLAYAEATRERAREIGAIADLVIGERLQRRNEHRERLAVLEAAILGTLLMIVDRDPGPQVPRSGTGQAQAVHRPRPGGDRVRGHRRGLSALTQGTLTPRSTMPTTRGREGTCCSGRASSWRWTPPSSQRFRLPVGTRCSSGRTSRPSVPRAAAPIPCR